MQSFHASALSRLAISASSCDLSGSWTRAIAALARSRPAARICCCLANRCIPSSVGHGCASYHWPFSCADRLLHRGGAAVLGWKFHSDQMSGQHWVGDVLGRIHHIWRQLGNRQVIVLGNRKIELLFYPVVEKLLLVRADAFQRGRRDQALHRGEISGVDGVDQLAREFPLLRGSSLRLPVGWAERGPASLPVAAAAGARIAQGDSCGAADCCAVASVASAAAAPSASKAKNTVREGFGISLPHRRVHAGCHCAVKWFFNFTFH